MNRYIQIRKVLIVTLLLNLSVSLTKIIYGYLTGSVGIISDGFHSVFDGASNLIGLIGVHIASKPPDSRHPYGHRKYETVFTIFIGLLMALTSIEIFKNMFASLTENRAPVVTAESFVIMTATLAVNIFVATYENRMGKKLRSEFLVADSKHTQSDIFVTIGVIASLIMVKLGFTQADPIAGAVVGIVVARTGYKIIRESAEILVDRSFFDIAAIEKIVSSVEGVNGCHETRTRGASNNVFVDIHVVVDRSLSVEDGHLIADRVEEAIKKNIPEVVDVVVHIEPGEKTPCGSER